MLKINEEQGVLFSGTNQLSMENDSLINIFLAINCTTGSLIWGTHYPGYYLGYFDNIWDPTNQTHIIVQA